MRNVAKLRGTLFYINEDLCPAFQEIKRSQISKFKQAKSEGKVDYFRHAKLISGSRSSTDPSGAIESATGVGAGTTFAAAVAAESKTPGESS